MGAGGPGGIGRREDEFALVVSLLPLSPPPPSLPPPPPRIGVMVPPTSGKRETCVGVGVAILLSYPGLKNKRKEPKRVSLLIRTADPWIPIHWIPILVSDVLNVNPSWLSLVSSVSIVHTLKFPRYLPIYMAKPL
jgi:hypothetical protein